MSDRNEYMKFYMRERRARQRAERLAAGGGNRAGSGQGTEDEEGTEPGGGGLVALGVVVGLVVLLVATWVIAAKPTRAEKGQDTTEPGQE